MKRSLLNRSVVIAAAALLATALASGQSGGTRGGGTTGGGGNIPNPTNPGIGTRPTNPTNPNYPSNTRTNPNQTPDQNSPDFSRPIFLSGRVMLDDGTPPPDSVRIDRICGARIIPEGNTDRKGHFSFQLGQNNVILADASMSGDPRDGMTGRTGSTTRNPMGGISERELIGCELRASLAGYRSESLNLTNRRSLDNPDVGTIILHRMNNVEGLTISATSLNAPKDAKKSYDKGHEALAKNKLDDARKHLEKAVEVYPKYAVAWYDLGIVNDRQQNADGARKAFGEALAADSKYVSPYEAMAQMAARETKWQDVADITDRMIRLNPFDFPRAFYLNAVAKLNLNQLDAAEKSATELISLDKMHQFTNAEQVLGVILAQKQDYPGAAQHIRKYIESVPPGTNVDVAKKQLAELEKGLAAREQNK